MQPTIYILLPVHNRKSITVNFIKLLLCQTYTNYQLVLIDDGSIDGTSEEVKKIIPDVIILTGNGNWWWAGSLNHGFFWLKRHVKDRDSVVLIINDDTEIGEDFLESGVSILRDNPKSLVLARAYDKNSGQLWDYGVKYNFRDNTIETLPNPSEVNCFSTRGLFLKFNDMLNIGSFHPVLIPHYRSDYEFTIRAKRRGYQLISDEGLCLQFDNTTTGIHVLDSSSLNTKEYLHKYFSKRYVNNPIYQFNYYLISFPFPWNIKYAFKTGKETVLLMLRLFFRDIKSFLEGHSGS